MAAYGNIDHDLKENQTVVTEIDRRVEHKLVNALKAKYPKIGFLGEEHGQQGSKDIYWLIDPIDGTESYVRGLPGVTSIIGLVENGQVTQSYIYDPVDDVMYSAKEGQGAYADGKKINVAQRSLERSIVAVTTAILKYKPEFINELYEKGPYYVSQYFGSGIKAVYMATGKIDGLITYNLENQGGGPWDYAPTSFLACEAGAIRTTLDQGGVMSSSYALLSPTINDDLQDFINKEFLDA